MLKLVLLFTGCVISISRADYGPPRPLHSKLIIREAGPSRIHKWVGFTQHYPKSIPKPPRLFKWDPYWDPLYTAFWVTGHTKNNHIGAKHHGGHHHGGHSGIPHGFGPPKDVIHNDVHVHHIHHVHGGHDSHEVIHNDHDAHGIGSEAHKVHDIAPPQIHVDSHGFYSDHHDEIIEGNKIISDHSIEHGDFGDIRQSSVSGKATEHENQHLNAINPPQNGIFIATDNLIQNSQHQPQLTSNQNFIQNQQFNKQNQLDNNQIDFNFQNQPQIIEQDINQFVQQQDQPNVQQQNPFKIKQQSSVLPGKLVHSQQNQVNTGIVHYQPVQTLQSQQNAQPIGQIISQQVGQPVVKALPEQPGQSILTEVVPLVKPPLSDPLPLENEGLHTVAAQQNFESQKV